MKKLFAILSIVLCLFMLAGCMGTPVIYHIDCDCPQDDNTPDKPDDDIPNTNIPTPEGALKTGLALVAGAGESFSATADKNGEGKYDVTMVAVLVDDNGLIQACLIDGIAASVKFDAAGKIQGDISAAVKTKNELGSSYGMVAWGGAIAEWDAQAKALADFAVGKTAAELRAGAVDETGKAPAGSDLASSATIYLGGYVSAIEKAVANAKHLGAKGGDTLKMACTASVSSSSDVNDKGTGTTQLDVDVTALTMGDGVITSCAFDAVQAKVNFDAKGTVTGDPSAAIKTKNELGSSYGMVAWGGAIAEWNVQAASLAAYVTGKTPAQVADIAVTETTAPAEDDLKSSVTIAIAGFKALIAKAAQ